MGSRVRAFRVFRFFDRVDKVPSIVDDSAMRETRLGTARLLACCALVLFAGAPSGARAQSEPVATAGPAEPSEPAAPAEPRADLGTVNELVRAGSYAAAESSLAELQQQFPDDPRVLFMRGELLLALDRAGEALPLLQRCVELDPERQRLQFQLGTALQATGDRAGAIEAFGREIERNDDPRVQVLAHLNRSLLLQRDESWEAAAAEIEAVLALEPTRLEAYGDLATVYIEAGRLDDAARSLEAGGAAGFHSARHLYSLGARYLQDETWEPAAAAFRSALELEPDYPEATRNLAVALDRMGREDEALELFRRYLELRPDASDAAKIRERIDGAAGG